MRVRIAIAGAVIGTAAGITISRAVRWWRTLGSSIPLEAAKALPGDELVAEPDGDRHPRDHHRRTTRGHLAVARPDGLRSRRLVQLRPARHARRERRST